VKTTVFLKRSSGEFIALLVALACGFYALTLGQDMNWDLLNYHLYNPYAFLNDRIEMDLAPAGLQSYFSPMLDIAYFFAISNLHPKTVGFLLGFLQGLNFLLVYKIAILVLRQHEQKNAISLLLALAAILTVGFLAEVGNTMHDSLVALFPLLSLWMVISTIQSLRKGNHRPAMALITAAGILAGIGIGLKLVSAIYALPICLSFFVLPLPWLKRFRLAFLYGLAVLAGLFATGSYWMFEMWRLFGNPLFPQFNNYFQGELATFDEIRDVRFLPRTLFDKVFYPVLFTLDPQRAAELKYEQFSWLAAFIAVLVLLISRIVQLIRRETEQRKWSPEASFLLAFFCLAYFFWLNIFGIYRYLIVIELLIPLLLFMIITYVVKWRYASRGAIVFIAILTVVNLGGAPDWRHSAWADEVYRMEPSVLTTGPEPAAVYLAGQPIAWIVPALDIQSPFIQIVPNMPVSAAYWQRARMLAADRVGKRYLVFETDNPDVVERARKGLANLGLTLVDDSCKMLAGFVGSGKIEYRFCEVEDYTEQE
jgi:hypothetical protein